MMWDMLRYPKRLALLVCIGAFLLSAQSSMAGWWQFQSVDTMKYSRDPSREYEGNLTGLKKIATEQAVRIAGTGATHMAIATPYDEEFLPVLKVWVAAARENNLNVWFRGNWSGWEGWFDFPSISRAEHIAKTSEFILDNPSLFQDGDVFSACPECENGGDGDPRMTGDIAGYRQFLIDEYAATTKAFATINKAVQSNFNSMNGDVAQAVMDPETTAALGGVVVIDHYVATPEQLDADVTKIAQQSQGQVILGEMGAPIPDINGSLTESEQATWISQALSFLMRNTHLTGLSYWTNQGGSTALWHDDGSPKAGVASLSRAFTPNALQLKVIDYLGKGVGTAQVTTPWQQLTVASNGTFSLPYLDDSERVTISASGFQPQTFLVKDLLSYSTVKLEPEQPSVLYQLVQRLQLWLMHFFNR